MDNLFISTGYTRNSTAVETCRSFEVEFGIRNFELSGGRHSKDLDLELEWLNRAGFKFQLHNYFPPPEIPFVLNLGSSSEQIRRHSILFCKRALELSSLYGCKYYSVHAGFCVDPPVNSLGSRFVLEKEINRGATLSLFLDSVRELKRFSQDLGVTLMIENNVLISENIHSGESLLLCSSSEEIALLIRKTGVEFLCDVGHLVVSAKSLGLDEDREVEACGEMASAFHLSSNNRLRDQNTSFINDGQLYNKVFPYLKKAKYSTLELNIKAELVSQEFDLLKQYLS